MMGEIIEALFAAALPVGILSFLLITWSLKSGRLTGANNRALRDQLKAMKKSRKAKEAKTKNPVHNKWLKFGGGFYGTVALYTFLIIEIREVIRFAQGYEGVEAAMAKLGNASFFDLAVNFFVNSLMNFIWAVAWPGFWAPKLHGAYVMVWFVIAYAGYWLGLNLARRNKLHN